MVPETKYDFYGNRNIKAVTESKENIFLLHNVQYARDQLSIELNKNTINKYTEITDFCAIFQQQIDKSRFKAFY